MADEAEANIAIKECNGQNLLGQPMNVQVRKFSSNFFFFKNISTLIVEQYKVKI